MGKCFQQAHDWVQTSNVSLNPKLSIWSNTSFLVSWSISLRFQMRAYLSACLPVHSVIQINTEMIAAVVFNGMLLSVCYLPRIHSKPSSATLSCTHTDGWRTCVPKASLHTGHRPMDSDTAPISLSLFLYVCLSLSGAGKKEEK